MPADESSRTELGNTGYELFVAALSVLSLVNIVLVSLLRDEALQTVVRVIDILLSVVFLIDFLARLRRAPSRADYVFRQFGWADLLAQSAVSAVQDPQGVSAVPGRATAPTPRTGEHRSRPPQGQGRERPVEPAAHRRPRSRVRQPGHVGP